MNDISRLNLHPPITVKCTICSTDFDKPATSRRAVCSFACKAERGRRYSREYQANGKRMLAELRRMFGGRRPTEEELTAIIKRKDRT